MNNHGQEQTPATDQEKTTGQPSALPEKPTKKKAMPMGKTILKILPGSFILLVAVILVVVGLTFSSAPTVETPREIDFSTELSSAESTYDINNSSAASAPQQTVCNGWYTNDLLIVLTNAVSESANGYAALATNQQKVIDSNRQLMLITWLSVVLLLVAFGGYFMLARLLQKADKQI